MSLFHVKFQPFTRMKSIRRSARSFNPPFGPSPVSYAMEFVFSLDLSFSQDQRSDNRLLTGGKKPTERFLAAMMRIFRLVDHDGDNMLSRQEMATFFVSLDEKNDEKD